MPASIARWGIVGNVVVLTLSHAPHALCLRELRTTNPIRHLTGMCRLNAQFPSQNIRISRLSVCLVLVSLLLKLSF